MRNSVSNGNLTDSQFYELEKQERCAEYLENLQWDCTGSNYQIIKMKKIDALERKIQLDEPIAHFLTKVGKA